MKKYAFMAACAMLALSAAAQDTYENARFLGSDLNGTARYVGMGGALEALGADISTMSSNPAGIGLFRHSFISLSFGGVNQQDAKKFDNVGTTNLSFDQVGFVYSMQDDDDNFLNFGFNYHKSRNFDQILTAANRLQASSLAKHVFGKSTLGTDANGGYTLETNTNGEWMGWRGSSDFRSNAYTQLDYMYTNAVTMDDVNTTDGTGAIVPINTYMEASDYWFNRAHSGWISDFDFNISGNLENRVFLGMSFGIKAVYYKGYSIYGENILDASNTPQGNHQLADERKIDGTGIDLKFGAIFRPIEESPFRIGIAITTPTWYNLESRNYSTLYNNTNQAVYNFGADNFSSSESYEFKYYTPWKFGLSMGHTVENYLALGASYEYSGYGSADTRVIDGYDTYGNEDSYSDDAMNDNTDRSLKGVHTLKLGAEMKPDPSFAIRLGYNYVSPTYETTGYRDNGLFSEGNTYASTADYTNWEATHRITCGMGYKYQNMNFDVAYQYSTTNGTFHPFQDSQFRDPDDNTLLTNIGMPTSVSNKRHQLLFTIGYTF